MPLHLFTFLYSYGHSVKAVYARATFYVASFSVKIYVNTAFAHNNEYPAAVNVDTFKSVKLVRIDQQYLLLDIARRRKLRH